MENDNLALAKEAFKIVSDVRAVIAKTKGTNEYVEEDLKHLDKMINGYKGAKKLLIGERECAFAAGWMVSMANNAVFLAYRRNVATPEIEDAYRKLPSTEAAMKDYEKFMNEDNEKAKALEAERRKFMEGQHGLDIVKSVFGGQSVEQAKEKLKEYQQAVAKSLGA